MKELNELRGIAMGRLVTSRWLQAPLWTPCAICGDSIGDFREERHPAHGVTVCGCCQFEVGRVLPALVERAATIYEMQGGFASEELHAGACIGFYLNERGRPLTPFERVTWLAAVEAYWHPAALTRVAA